MEKELLHLVIPMVYADAIIHRLNAISLSKLNIHPREYYDVGPAHMILYY